MRSPGERGPAPILQGAGPRETSGLLGRLLTSRLTAAATTTPTGAAGTAGLDAAALGRPAGGHLSAAAALTRRTAGTAGLDAAALSRPAGGHLSAAAFLT